MKKQILNFCGKVILLFNLAVLFNTQCRAVSFFNLSIKGGLSSRQVYQVEKDSAGFIWVYTHVGVDRYDGNEIKHYELANAIDSKDHILSSTVMTCDRNGLIQVAMKNGKIYAYDRRTDSFLLSIDLSEYFAEPVLNDILFDKENHLYLCLSTGLYQWDEREGPVLVALEGHVVNCLIQTDYGVFYAGTNKEVYQLVENTDKRSFSGQQIDLPRKAVVESMYVVEDKLYIGTFSDGVFVWDKSTGRVCPLGEFVPHLPVRAFTKTLDGYLLIGVDGGGLLQIDAETDTLISHYMANEDDVQCLAANTVTDICVDERGYIWIGTSTNGVSCLQTDIPGIRHIKHERNNPNSLKSDHVNVIIQDSEGDYWYGTNNGVSLYQVATRKWTHFLDNVEYGANVVLALGEDSRRNIYVGGYGFGIYRISKETGQMHKMESRKDNAGKGFATDYVYTIYTEGDELWAGGIEGDLTCYNLLTGTYTYYPIDCIGDIKLGNNRSLLMGCCDGLVVFDRKTGQSLRQHRFGNIILHYPIRCLLQTQSGDIWMATDGDGLVCYNPMDGSAQVYTTHDGLVSNSINNLLEDSDGCLWFSTEQELYRLDPLTENIVSANDFLGIAWGGYNSNAAFSSADGNITLGTSEGAVVFSSSWNYEEPDSVKLLLTDFKLPYESVKVGTKDSPLKMNINDTQKIRLDYGQNSFSLSFSALNFISQHRIRYEYMLENYGGRWEHTNAVRSVSYMNLSPGKYVFRLRAFNKYNGQQIGERNLEIVISYPLWLSWWAVLIYAMIFLIISYIFVENRKHKIIENRIKDKIDSFVSIAHDIRSPISLIKAPLCELEAQEKLPEESRKTIRMVMKNVEKLTSMVTQLLYLQKAEQHAEERLKISLYDIEAYLKEKMAEFRSAAMQKGVDLQLEVEPDMPQIWIDREKMDRIMDNLLSNALKYTEKGEVRVCVRAKGKKWSVEIKDTGIGIPVEEQGNIFHEYYRARNAINHENTGVGIGLMITRRIVKQHHGDITFNSVEGKGTTFTVVFPRKIRTGVVVEMKGDDSKIPVIEKVIRKDGTEDGKNVILLAEDDVDMREYLTNSLSSEYRIVSVVDGGKALEMAREINPDLIISDIVMPVLEGDELCRILKSSVETSHIPVILLTALSERENIIFGLEAGASDYIIKPFDLSVLKVRIRNILQNRQHLRNAVLSADVQPDEMDYTSQLDKEFMDKVMAVVEERLSDSEFSINDFCRMLGMSRTSVYNKLKTLSGQGPNDFIRIVRLNKARELLVSRRYTIGEVAVMVGFSDPKYFSTCFKKQFGISPSKI